jgi:hypothetical protein
MEGTALNVLFGCCTGEKINDKDGGKTGAYLEICGDFPRCDLLHQ